MIVVAIPNVFTWLAGPGGGCADAFLGFCVF
jgi:hypothetical protein